MRCLPREKNNAAAGLMNLARNIGGSFGISFVTTVTARRAQVHQVQLVEKLNAANPQFQSALHGMTGDFFGRRRRAWLRSSFRAAACLRPVQANVIGRPTMLAYIDNFWVLGVVIFCLIPFVFLIKKAKPGVEIVAH